MCVCVLECLCVCVCVCLSACVCVCVHILSLSVSLNCLLAQQVQELPRLKLLMGQLLALRVQHGRSPGEQLRRFINGDLRPISLPRSVLTL